MSRKEPDDRAVQDVKSALDLLRQKFVARFPGRVATLDALLGRARTGDAEALADAIQAAHKLRGTAGTFGQPAIGELAGAAEDALTRCRDQADDDARWDAAEATMETLRERARALAADAS